MGREFRTPIGALRRTASNGRSIWQLCCPGCGEWGELDDDQLHGRVSVDHGPECSYHETHDFWQAVRDSQ